MKNLKQWSKPSMEVSQIRLAKNHTFNQGDAQSALKSPSNQS